MRAVRKLREETGTDHRTIGRIAKHRNLVFTADFVGGGARPHNSMIVAFVMANGDEPGSSPSKVLQAGRVDARRPPGAVSCRLVTSVVA